MKNVIAALMACMLLSGCATPMETWKQIKGVSTKGVEETRINAMSKVFDYDYKTCYDKVEALLKEMPNVSIYAKDKSMIAVYVINPNTTSVGLFFTDEGAGRTKVEVSSESTPNKEWIATNIFAEKVQKPQTANVDLF